MYWTNFWQPTIHAQQNIFEKNLIEVGSSHLYASFASKFVNYSRHSESEKCLKTVKSLYSKEDVVNFEFFWKFLKRTVKMWATILVNKTLWNGSLFTFNVSISARAMVGNLIMDGQDNEVCQCLLQFFLFFFRDLFWGTDSIAS